MWKPTLRDDSHEPIFRQIVQSIADDVATGKLAVGARLPPHRDLSDEILIARGTIARAYAEAEKLGLVRGEVGRGTIVLPPDSGERRYSSLLVGPTVLTDLGTNLPLSGIDPDPSEALRRLAERPDRKALFRYLPPDGAERHRIAGARWLERMSVAARASDVIVCAGAQHALFVVCSHLRRQTIYVEELTYPGMHGIAEALGATLVPIEIDGEGMSPSHLAAAARRSGAGVVYCMPTIHNPTGAVMSEARRHALAALASAHDLFIVEDAANRMLVPKPPPPIRAYAPERTFLVASVSKVLSPGLRVAFVVGPPRERAGVVRLSWATQWMPPALGAEIVSMWLEDGVVDRTLASKRREATRRQALARRALGAHRITAHPHALHVWLALSARRVPVSADRFAAVAAEHGLVVTPSSAFWARASVPPPPAVRISLGGVDDLRALSRGLARLRSLLRARASSAVS
jgi:DNA-binding transcriptional MocR family regulator